MQSNRSSFTMMEVPYHYQFRIIVIGDAMVGKSSLLKAFSEGTFSNSEPTVGVDFFSKIIRINRPSSSGTHMLSTPPRSSKTTEHRNHNRHSSNSKSPSYSQRYDANMSRNSSNRNNQHNVSSSSSVVDNSIIIKLQIWDTAGQERFRSIVTSYYRNSVGIVLVYDVTNRESYEHLVDWLREAQRFVEPTTPMTPSEPPDLTPSTPGSSTQKHHVPFASQSKVVYLIMGCKTDLENQRVVSYEEGQAFANTYGLKFVETSSKQSYNVDAAFQLLAEDVYNKITRELAVTNHLRSTDSNISCDQRSMSTPNDGIRLGPLVGGTYNSDVSNPWANRLLVAEPVPSFMGGCC